MLTIPAPDKNNPGPGKPLITEEPAVTDEKYAPMFLTRDPAMQEGWNSTALNQLKDQASK